MVGVDVWRSGNSLRYVNFERPNAKLKSGSRDVAGRRRTIGALAAVPKSAESAGHADVANPMAPVPATAGR